VIIKAGKWEALKGNGREAFRRWVDEEAYRGLQLARRTYILYKVVQHGIPYYVEGGRQFRYRDSSRSTVCEDKLVVFLRPCWGSPSQQKLLSSRSPVAAPAVRSRTDVSAFALVVYWHNPNGTSIVLPGSRAPPRGGAEADFIKPKVINKETYLRCLFIYSFIKYNILICCVLKVYY